MKSIKFKIEHVNKIIDGFKTQTRRPIKEAVGWDALANDEQSERLRNKGVWKFIRQAYEGVEFVELKPKYIPGETVFIEGVEVPIFLKITEVDVERLTEIMMEGCIKEGVQWRPGQRSVPHFDFYYIWDELYRGTEFESSKNPFVWVYEFERTEVEG